ncbi:MAG: TIGR00159 family protein [Deltaproteobacteria bacterium]|nr:TIGR00159 family protein [Deltaproteobacteria bacterium]
MSELFFSLHWYDVLDILIVAFIIYKIIDLIKGTRAVQMVVGLGVLFVASLLSQKLHLVTLHWILTSFLGSIILVIIVIFQNDIRKALMNMGQTPFFRKVYFFGKESEIEELCKGISSLAERKVGALIILERNTGLRDFIEKGVQLDAKMSGALLVSIFNKESPIHDGAVIISEGRIAAAACFLPLTQDPTLEKELGTRHRAAIGLTEENDSVAIVVSEETGKVSFAIGGKLSRKMDEKGIKKVLQRLFVQSSTGTLGGIWRREE